MYQFRYVGTTGFRTVGGPISGMQAGGRARGVLRRRWGDVRRARLILDAVTKVNMV